MSTKHILLVDGDPVDVGWISGCLQVARESNVLKPVATVAQAITCIKQTTIDVVLLDSKLVDAYQSQIDQLAYKIEHPPVIVLGDWGLCDLDTRESTVADMLPKSLLTPLLLTHAIHYAIRHAQSERELLKLAHYDTLTGAANRRLFLDRFNQTIMMTRRNKNACGLILIDLDEFKPINDTYGHDAGDHLLKIFAKRVQTLIREADTFARLGGDEFALLLPSIEKKEDIENVAQKILKKLVSPVTWKGNKMKIKASLGLACFPDKNVKLSVTSIYKAADKALYQAKQTNKNSYCFYSVD